MDSSVVKVAGGALAADKAQTLDPSVLPPILSTQCRGLIESYHDLHGYACLPNTLWRAELGDFINKHPCLRQLLRKASTTRSAKASNKGFVEIATAILSLEILASDFATWGVMFPEAKSMANALLRTRGSRMPLMDYYLYPPKHISPSILAALAPPLNRPSIEPQGSFSPELSGQKQALNYANAVLGEQQGKPAPAAPAVRASSYL